MDKTDSELERTRPTGMHHVAREQEDILTLVEVFRETHLFQHHPGRHSIQTDGVEECTHLISDVCKNVNGDGITFVNTVAL